MYAFVYAYATVHKHMNVYINMCIQMYSDKWVICTCIYTHRGACADKQTYSQKHIWKYPSHLHRNIVLTKTMLYTWVFARLIDIGFENSFTIDFHLKQHFVYNTKLFVHAFYNKFKDFPALQYWFLSIIKMSDLFKVKNYRR